MEYNRPALKQSAKDIIRRARPRTWTVTLLYLVITSLMTNLTSNVTTRWTQPLLTMVERLDWYSPLTPYEAARLIDQLSATLSVVLPIALIAALFSAIMSYGYSAYALKLWRGQRTGYGDVFSALRILPRVALATFLTGLFTFLWLLLAIVPMLVLTIGFAFLGSQVFFVLYPVILTVALSAFMLWVTLRYAMAPYWIITDRKCGALESLTRSKRSLQGSKGKLFGLGLSFIGWYLPVVLIAVILVFLDNQMGLGWGLPDRVHDILFAVASFVLTLPLNLWVTPYVNVSLMGFYDRLAGASTPAAPPPFSVPARYDAVPPVFSSEQAPPSSSAYVPKPPEESGLAGANDPWNLE